MVLGFALFVAAGLLIEAGISGRSLSDVVRGIATANHRLKLSLPDATGGDSDGTVTEDNPAFRAFDEVTGLKRFEGTRVAAWIYPYLVFGRKHGWSGKVTSGYRTRAEQERIYNSGVRPAAKPGTSNHEGINFPRGAVDVTEAEELDRILDSYPNRKLIFAGAKDPVHFSNPHGGSY